VINNYSSQKKVKMHTPFKFIISFLLIALYGISAFAQVVGEWTLRTPFKKSTDIIEMHVTPDQTIHLLDNATYSGVLISENNGVSYKRATISPSKDMHILNDDLLFALRQNVLIKTTDRFATSSYILSGSGYECVFFLDQDSGFVAGTNGQIKKTTDGGLSWQSLASGSSRTLKDIYFIDANLGFACGEFGTFLGTTDGGETWSDITLGTNGYTHNKILFINSTQGIIVGVGGEVFYTSDAGVNWAQGTTNTILQINDVKLINGNLMAVGHAGLVLKSSDLGQTWTLQILNSFKDNFSVTETSSEIYVGSEGGIYKSFDGTNWTFQGGLPWSDLEYASFANDNQGLIAGIGQTGSGVEIDVMLRTTDGGLNWEETPLPSDGYRGVHMLPNGKAITARYDVNRVAFSSDFGETWSTINGPTITTQYITEAVWLKSEDDFFVGGGNSFPSMGLHRYQTGTGWTHNPSVGNVENIQSLDNDFGILSNSSNQSFKTLDGGDTWQSIGSASGVINIIDENTFYIGNYVTYDGGSNLELNTVPMNSYRFFDANTAIGAYNNGFVYKTVDAGVSWQVMTTDGLPNANCCDKFHISESTIIAYGTNYNSADIYTLSIAGLITNAESIKETLSKVVVYPNPTSDKLYVKGLSDNVVEAIIYNVNGQQTGVFSLTNSQESLDISHLVSGSYFVHLKSDSKTESIHRIIKK
jgi:photosystem II stability/assembly factor-like uncharacterized protein